MSEAYGAVFVAFFLPVFGLIVACMVLNSVPKGSRRARVARIAVAIAIFQLVSSTIAVVRIVTFYNQSS